MGHLVDIQTVLKSLQKDRKKLKYIFMTILRKAELLKTMNWLALIATLLEILFLKNHKR